MYSGQIFPNIGFFQIRCVMRLFVNVQSTGLYQYIQKTSHIIHIQQTHLLTSKKIAEKIAEKRKSIEHIRKVIIKHEKTPRKHIHLSCYLCNLAYHIHCRSVLSDHVVNRHVFGGMVDLYNSNISIFCHKLFTILVFLSQAFCSNLLSLLVLFRGYIHDRLGVGGGGAMGMLWQ